MFFIWRAINRDNNNQMCLSFNQFLRMLTKFNAWIIAILSLFYFMIYKQNKLIFCQYLKPIVNNTKSMRSLIHVLQYIEKKNQNTFSCHIIFYCVYCLTSSSWQKTNIEKRLKFFRAIIHSAVEVVEKKHRKYFKGARK